MKDAVIVGGGIAGLACAWNLTKAGHDVVVLEKSDRLGGRIRTSHSLDIPVESGASFFAGFYRQVGALVEEMGIDVTSEGESQETWVSTVDGRSGPIWPARVLIGSRVVPLRARIHGLFGLARLFVASRRVVATDMGTVVDIDNETVSSWSPRAFGTVFSSLVVEPLLRALFFWDTDRTSRALLPLVVKGVRSDRRFFRMRGGMSRLTDALADRVSHRLGVDVQKVVVSDDHFVVVAGSEQIQAKAIVIATPALDAKALLASAGAPAPSALSSVSYSEVSVGVVANTSDHLWPLETNRTVVVAGGHDRRLVALKPILREDGSLSGCRIYAQRLARSTAFADAIPDIRNELELLELSSLAEIVGDGEVVDEVRWENALPLFDVGFPSMVARGDLSKGLPDGIFLAGDYTHGPHLEGATASANDAAASVAVFLAAREG